MPVIDITSSDGNIFVAMSIAKKYLVKQNKELEYQQLFDKVMKAKSYEEACHLIEEMTDGGVTFFDPDKEEVD